MFYISVKYRKNYVESEVISKNPFFIPSVEKFAPIKTMLFKKKCYYINFVSWIFVSSVK